jgi:exonuclease SbcC
MRPLYLELKAFGPYADRQRIDFAELRDYRFFLIHGPTGSGKTTLLDAMCYALYGDTSGKIRSGENMRSDYAEATTVTEVCFDFAVGADWFRVRRIPRQFIARKRGEGMMEVGENAQLFKLDESRQEIAVLAEKTSRVTAEVQRILGFKSDQFRQVVLLPQGDFRRLLLAESSERQAIMQMLFKTEYYSVVEQRLKEEAKQWTQQYAETDIKIQELLTLAEAESLEELQQRTTNDQANLQFQADQIILAAQAVAAKRQLLVAAQEEQRILNERQQAGDACNALLLEQAAVKAKRHELERALQAAAAGEFFSLVQTRRQEFNTAMQSFQQSETGLSVATERQQAANQRWLELQAREPEIEQLIQEKTMLEEWNNRTSGLTQAASDARLLRMTAEAAATAANKAATDVKLQEQKLTELNAGEQSASRIAAELGSRQANLRQWQGACARRAKYDQAQVALLAAGKRLEQAALDAERARQRAEQAQLQLTEVQERWELEQAAMLAGELREGAPCPVCGSTEHPAKAKPVDGAPDQAVLRQQRQHLAECNRLLEQARKLEYEVQAERDALMNAAKLLEEELGDLLDCDQAVLAAKLSAAQQDWQQASRASEEAVSLRDKIAQAQQLLITLKQQAEQAELASRQAENQAGAAEAVVLERQAAIPAEFRELTVLQQKIAAVETRLNGLRTLLADARQQAEAAKNQLAQATASQMERSEVLRQARLILQEAEHTKSQRLSEAGFADEADYQAAVRTLEQRTLMEQQIREFAARLTAARERLERAEQAAARILQQPDVAALEAAVSEASEQEQQLRVAAELTRDRLQQANGLIVRLEKLVAERQEAEEKHSLFSGLHEISAGRLTGVSFERYVLGFLLDEVSLFANLRLKEMTRGRYRLRRREDRSDKRKGAGLDLEVIDGFTGEARPVQTLSGGETFLASLSLALGLADVVQSRAGGIHLETLFVDEGFGTLDPETLDLAIKALLDLQAGGRLVGIISHVPELKESIDARLAIIPTDKGSRAEFHIG